MAMRIGWIMMMLGALFVSLYAIVTLFTIAPNSPGFIAAKQLEEGFRYVTWINWLYVHIASGTMALIIGPFLLVERRPIHRSLGIIYTSAIIISSSVSFVLAWQASGGPIAKTGFMALNICWLLMTLAGIVAIWQRNIAAHRKWMIRSYALTFGGVTLRVLLPLFIALFGMENFEYSYRAIAWSAWLPNLFVVEWWMRRAK